MSSDETAFHEVSLTSTPLRDLHLTIAGTPLAAIVAEFEAELARVGIHRLRPRWYLSTEWGVPFNTVAVAIPFYLARPHLTAVHAQRVGYVEGASRADILRYLRHEMGHVVNYAYRLYDREEWVLLFGSIAQPYVEEYRPEPFSRRHVRHLPGWYAQKHPDEDWAETFAVWMTPGLDWRAEYADWPEALAKLEYCDRTVAALRDQEPVVRAEDRDEDVSELSLTVDKFYQALAPTGAEPQPRLDGDLRAVFEEPEAASGSPARRSGADLIRRLERELMADVYRWTGHFPERTRALLRHFAKRAQELNLTYAPGAEDRAIVALTALVTTLAMNYIQQGAYVPDLKRPGPFAIPSGSTPAPFGKQG